MATSTRAISKVGPCVDCGNVVNVKQSKGDIICRRCITVRAGKARAANLSGPSNPNWKGGRLTCRRKYIERNKQMCPEKWAARAAVRKAIKDGVLCRECCIDCGTTERVEGHHEDYSQPLVVVWLCRPCHRKRHGYGPGISYRDANKLREDQPCSL